LAEEVLRWSGAVSAPPEADIGGTDRPRTAATNDGPAPLVAANGDVVVEYLLARLTAGGGPLFGHVQADRSEGLELLEKGDVLVAGCHGSDVPTSIEDQRLAFIHLVDRHVGLALRRDVRLRSLRQVTRFRLASRPQAAGVRARFDEELRRQGIDPDVVHSSAVILPSHREVACAVARGEVDAGLASVAWGRRVGLDCMPLYRETYGLLVRASLLGDPRVVQLCEVAQSQAFRRQVGAVPGYDARFTGIISYRSPKKQAQ
jgi:molybdate-binding protein